MYSTVCDNFNVFFNQPVFNLIEVETFSHLNCIKFQLLFKKRKAIYQISLYII